MTWLFPGSSWLQCGKETEEPSARLLHRCSTEESSAIDASSDAAHAFIAAEHRVRQPRRRRFSFEVSERLEL